MTPSLYIQNYRNLKDLRIASLARVNLFTGKNNTGKSSILEAMAIFASKGEVRVIEQILNERGENYRRTDSDKKNILVSNLKSFCSLFTDRKLSFEKDDDISIGTTEDTLFGTQLSAEQLIILHFVKYYEEMQKDPDGEQYKRKIVLESDSEQHIGNVEIGIQIRFGNNTGLLRLDQEIPLRFWSRGLGEKDNFQFIRTRNIDREINSKLWDSIILTEKEQYIIDALKIIEPTTERIAFIEEGNRERNAVIKLSNNPTVLPLRSMGDGINRILTIILALVNCENGYLLLDEFENGLHHTVQKQLWQIVFELSKKLNIQVFATTHSEDCIAGFEQVLNSGDNANEGKMIRLEYKNGAIRQVEYNANDLRITNDRGIETR